MEEKQIKILIDKFWQGTATVSEKQALISLLNKKDTQWQQLLETMFHNPDFPVEPEIQEDRSINILDKLHEEIAKKQVKRKTALLRPWYWSAAAILMIVGTALIWFTQYKPTVLPDQSVAMQQPVSVKFIEENNDTETVRTFDLPDGSRVKLFGRSQLRYNASFSKGNRDLNLTGIATFEVAKDPEHPFTVTAMGYSTTALGTKFTVHGRTEKPFRVKLFEGKVVVRQQSKAAKIPDAYLKPGEELTVNLKKGLFAVRRFGSEVTVPQKKIIPKPEADQLLHFSKTPLATVFEKLNTAYGVVLVYDKTELGTLSFTGEFHRNEPLSLAISSLCALNNLTYQQDGNTIVIRKKEQ